MNMTGDEKIVIGMPLKNSAKTIHRAVESVLFQKGLRRDIVLLIVDDNSDDDWKEEIAEYFEDPRLHFVNVNFEKTYAVRNFILEYVRKNMPFAAYVGRLDADDFLVDEYALSRVEEIIDRYNPDVIIAGNKQMLNGKIIRENRADIRFFDEEYLENRLFQMANGILEGELPSCNVFVKPHVEIKYKDIESAEDHWYLVELLLNKDKYRIYIAEDVIYAVYSLDGKVTENNKKMRQYLKSRKMLYEYYLTSVALKGGENK